MQPPSKEKTDLSLGKTVFKRNQEIALRVGSPGRFRSIFISDFHMGAKSFDAAALVDFLKNSESDYLYLVGDIVDGWKLNKRWHWTEDCNRVIDELARKVAEGTKLYYVPGNHDETVRIVSPLRRLRFSRRARIRIRSRVIHKTADRKRLLVIHGDQFDRKIIQGKLARVSDKIYDWLLDLTGAHGAQHIEIKGKIKKFSMAKALSKPGKWALYLLNNFESAVYRAARLHAADGLICGHTHIPALKNIRGIIYGNCGSWLRSGHTALVEHGDGRLALIDWPSFHDSASQPSLFGAADLPPVHLIADSSRYRPVTNMIVHAIRRTWPETATTEITDTGAGQENSNPAAAVGAMSRIDWALLRAALTLRKKAENRLPVHPFYR